MAQPDDPLIQQRVKLGFTLLEQRRIADAASIFQNVIDQCPDCADAHFGLGWTLLVTGNFERGWEENHWRLKVASLSKPRGFDRATWDGSPLDGRTILLHKEQGSGDVIQFIRYAPLVAQRGGRVLLGCDPTLGNLLKSTPGVAALAPSADKLPAFDVELSLHSLPRTFRTTLATIPANVPYVFPDRVAVERWQRRIDRSARAFHVGLCWAGDPRHQNDRNRSIDPALLALFAGLKNTRFYSLQKQMTVEQARRLPAALNLVDWGIDLTNFTETAAAMLALDLIISVDTSVAHLAGALARPVWTLLPFHADWRWLLNRPDSPWYPTMRLLRQPAPLDWPSVLRNVAMELQTLADQRR